MSFTAPISAVTTNPQVESNNDRAPPFKQKISRYSSKEFAALVELHDQIPVAADQEIRVYDVNPTLAFRMKSLKSRNVQRDQLARLFFGIVNDILLLQSKQLSKLAHVKLGLCCDPLNGHLYLSFTGLDDGVMHFKNVQQRMIVLQNLYRRMVVHKVSTVQLHPDHILCLADLSRNSIECVKRAKDAASEHRAVKEIFEKYLPPEYVRVALECGNSSERLIRVKEDGSSVGIRSKAGITIRLESTACEKSQPLVLRNENFDDLFGTDFPDDFDFFSGFANESGGVIDNDFVLPAHVSTFSEVRIQSMPDKVQTAQKVITYTANEFADLFKTKNFTTIPDSHEIRVTGINPVLAYELKRKLEGKIDAANVLFDIFDDLLQLHGKNFESKWEGEFWIHSESNNNEMYLALKAPMRMNLVVKDDGPVTTAGLLFRRMVVNNVNTFSIDARKDFFLDGIPESVIAYILEQNKRQSYLERLTEYLQSWLPPEYYKVTLEMGDTFTLTVPSNGSGRLMIWSQTGIKISLIPHLKITLKKRN